MEETTKVYLGDWILLNTSRTLASHTFAHSHFLSFYRSLSYNSSDKIIVSQLFCNKGQASPRYRGDQNQFETVSKRHRCCAFPPRAYVTLLLALLRVVYPQPACFRCGSDSWKDDRPDRSRTVIERCASLRFGNRLINDIQYSKLKQKNARRQYIRVILRNLFINNNIVSHTIQEFLLSSTVSVWHSPHRVP